VRAHEKRRELEKKQPTEKLFRLLRQRPKTLKRCRDGALWVPGVDEMRRFAHVGGGKAYHKAIEGVTKILIELAPELFQDLNQPWLATLKGLEADRAIAQLEESAPRPTVRRRGL
jgi:hypothetical protein